MKKEPHKPNPYLVIWGVTCVVMGFLILFSNHETANHAGFTVVTPDSRAANSACYQPGLGGIAP